MPHPLAPRVLMGAPGAHRGLRRTRVTKKKAPSAWYNHLGVRSGVLGARLAGLSLVKFCLAGAAVPGRRLLAQDRAPAGAPTGGWLIPGGLAGRRPKYTRAVEVRVCVLMLAGIEYAFDRIPGWPACRLVWVWVPPTPYSPRSTLARPRAQPQMAAPPSPPLHHVFPIRYYTQAERDRAG